MKRSLRIALLAVALAVLAAVALDLGRMGLAPTRSASIDAVRIRNALVAELGTPADTDWRPEAAPPAFNRETLPAPEAFTRVVAQVLEGAPAEMTDFETARRLARHLGANARQGRPIQANSWLTYQRITAGQGGYCSDFTQTINALALAAGLEVREWGFAWESLANGHAFNEIWEPSLGKWLLLDSFHGFTVADAETGVPLSALEFRDHLLSGADPAAVRFLPIGEESFDQERIDYERRYYERGMPRMFLLMGNNVFSYDTHPLIRLTEALPRSVEMLTAILLGEHPRFLFVPPADRPELRAEVEALVWTRLRLVAEIALGAIAGITVLLLLVSLLRARGARPESAAARDRPA